MSRSEGTLVVGGGIVGFSAAYFLARRGEPVTVVERDAGPGDGASAGNAGILALGHPPLPHPGLATEMARMFLSRTNPVYIAPRPDLSLLSWILRFRRACSRETFDRSLRVLAELGWAAGDCMRDLIEGEAIDCEYHRTGWLEVFRTPRALDKARRTADLLRGHGYTVDELSGDALRQREPAYRDEVVAALHFVDSGFANPGRFMAALAERAVAQGARVVFGAEARRLDVSGGAFRGVELSDGRRLEAARLLLAAGSWTTGLARSLGFHIPMQPGKGYHVNLQGIDPRPGTTAVLAETFVAVTPLDGGLRLAGTVELSGLNRRLMRRRLEMLSMGARDYVRGIEGARVESEWCGLRPMIADGLPAVGWIPGLEGVFLATGHAMMGFLLGPLSGRLAAEALIDGRPSIDIAALDPARF